MKVYYAHSMSIYNTPQELRDIRTLEQLGFTVVNPNDKVHQDAVNLLKCDGKGAHIMQYFEALVDQCDAVVFRALPDGTIPAGVLKEVEIAQCAFKPVLELPSMISRRGLSVEQTREYLHEIGQR